MIKEKVERIPEEIWEKCVKIGEEVLGIKFNSESIKSPIINREQKKENRNGKQE